jgi:hypothetical protein
MDLTNAYISYRLINLLSKPFNRWNAYKLGIIDEDGEIVKEPETDKEKKSFSTFERIILKIKKIIVKLTGKSRAMAILTTIALIENKQIYDDLYTYISKSIIHNDLIVEANMNECKNKFLDMLNEDKSYVSMAKKYGISEKEAKEKWDKAEEQVKKEYKDVEAYSDKFYQIVMGIFKKMNNIKEDTVTGDVAPIIKPLNKPEKRKLLFDDEDIDIIPSISEPVFRKPDGNDVHGIPYFDISHKDVENMSELLNGKEHYKRWRHYIKSETGIHHWANRNYLKPFSVRYLGDGNSVPILMRIR